MSWIRRCAALVAAVLLLVVLLFGAGCIDGSASHRYVPPTAQAEVTLTVFAAASLANAFAEIAEAFEGQQEGVDVVLNAAGSQQLAQQLRLGAPADVFASADPRQMQAAVGGGRVDPEAPQSFAGNRLVVVAPVDNPAGLTRLQDLTQPGLRLVLAAAAVPAGRYSRVFLERAARDAAFGPAYEADVLARVASFEQNVRAVLTKVVLGEADAGIVYTSDLTGAPAAGLVQIEIPDAFNPLALYPIAPVANTDQPDLARTFIAFVRSPEGQEILKQYGFTPARTS